MKVRSVTRKTSLLNHADFRSSNASERVTCRASTEPIFPTSRRSSGEGFRRTTCSPMTSIPAAWSALTGAMMLQLRSTRRKSPISVRSGWISIRRGSSSNRGRILNSLTMGGMSLQAAVMRPTSSSFCPRNAKGRRRKAW